MKGSHSYWLGRVEFGESVEISLCVRNQVLLLGAHGEQRLWKHNENDTLKSKTHTHTVGGWLLLRAGKNTGVNYDGPAGL